MLTPAPHEPAQPATKATGTQQSQPQEEPPSQATIEHLLVEAAIKHPEADALVGEFGTLSYADLLIRAQNIAVLLRQQGVTAGHFVGVAMDQSPSMVTAIAGILLAGAAYVPLDRDRLRDSQALHRARASGMKIVLSSGRNQDALTSRSDLGTVIDLSRVEQQTMPSSSETRLPSTTPGSIAALLFCPETEREALAVAIPHRAIVRLATTRSLFQSHANETFLLHPASPTRTHFLELWGSLLQGATLALAPEPPQPRTTLITQTDQLAGCIRKFGVSSLCLTVAALHDLMDHAPQSFSRLNQLVIEHDGRHGPLSPQRLQSLAASAPRLRIVHTYGSLETSGYASSHLVPQPYTAQATVPIGAPIDGIRVHIVDRELFPTKGGEIGELAFAGDGVADGYWKDPAATARRFLRSAPAEGPDSSYLFLTGERARWRSDGLLELHGRSMKHPALDPGPPAQRSASASTNFGFAAADVEAMLLSQRKVRDAAVLEMTDEQGQNRHVAFIALDPAAPPPSQPGPAVSLEDSMRSVLPAAALPAMFRYVDSIPRDGKGAVDPHLLEQRWLKETDRMQLEERRQQEMLDHVRGIWMRLLQVQSVGYDEDFFEAGGTQVQMIRMHVELNRKYPGAITMANLSVLTTVRKIYEHLLLYMAETSPIRRGA